MLFDSQVWTGPVGSDRSSVDAQASHFHNGVDVPFGKPLTGVYDPLIAIQDFKNPGEVQLIEFRFGGQKNMLRPMFKFPTTADAHPHERKDFPARIDTTQIGDGFYMLILQSRLMHEDGTRRLTRLRVPVETRNGRPAGGKDEALDKITGAGWVVRPGEDEDDEKGNLRGYANVNVRAADIPLGPAPKLWTPKVSFTNSRGRTMNGFAALDPDFHHGSEGTVLFDSNGAESVKLSIDTTKLAPGPHKLFLKADDRGAFEDFVLQAVLVIGFEVAA